MSEHRPAKTDLWDKGWWLWSLILYATLLFAGVEVWFDDRYTAAQKGEMVILTVIPILTLSWRVCRHKSLVMCDSDGLSQSESF